MTKAQSFMLVYHFRPVVSSFSPLPGAVGQGRKKACFFVYFTIPKHYFSYLRNILLLF